MVGLGNIYYNTSKWLLAEKYYLLALEHQPKSEKVLEYLGWIYGYHLEIDHKGKEYASKALEINPDNFYAHFISAYCQESNP